MRLDCVYARFYKSFNFDYVRKSHPNATPNEWDLIDDDFFPYIEIHIDGRITAVVGANESGKSHLLSAIRKAVLPDGIQQRDLCRYSPFFNVERGKTTWPHLGLKWSEVTPDEATLLRKAVTSAPADLTNFHMFREGPDVLRLFFPQRDGKFVEAALQGSDARNFGLAFLPRPFEIRAGVGLPNAIPLAWLREEMFESSILSSRKSRNYLMAAGVFLFDNLPNDGAQLASIAPSLYPTFHQLKSDNSAARSEDEDPKALALARDLLVKLALIDPERLSDLATAIIDGDDGHANALVARINDQLAKHLNFPKFWAQDRDFSLKVSPREVDLVFTIQDRTGTEYTFAERSNGLKYFLSYLIQAQTREAAKDTFEILLMDEPDAYLSAEAQQDLLKIFDTFAHPEGSVRPVQVVYVTHSPFLLDKNHAERIRVLQKGKASEGTRVIRNASRNHYEPLRSAFGAFVGETAFIGSCNLLVEGAADQVLLAGASRLIRLDTSSAKNSSLDLNRIVIVPCGSASQMPYTVYLIRGRDTEKPPVIALLDSDKAGLDAARALRGGEKRIGRLIKPEYVVDIASAIDDDLIDRVPVEIEDLIPPALAVRAANEYFKEVQEFRGDVIKPFEVSHLPDPMPDGRSIFDALNELAKAQGSHIDKIGFARAAVAICGAATAGEDPDVGIFLNRMRSLFRLLSEKQRSAERDAARARISTQVDRLQTNFRRDHPETATAEEALYLAEDVLDVLDDTAESDAVRASLIDLRRRFSLDDDPAASIADYEGYLTAISGLPHSFEHQTTQNSTTKVISAVPAKQPKTRAAAARKLDAAAKQGSTPAHTARKKVSKDAS